MNSPFLAAKVILCRGRASYAFLFVVADSRRTGRDLIVNFRAVPAMTPATKTAKRLALADLDKKWAANEQQAQNWTRMSCITRTTIASVHRAAAAVSIPLEPR
jgi:hypothetical protein